jgi:hypothetical protein
MGDSSFAGQFADLLLGQVDQAYVAPRARKVVQLLSATTAVLSGCDDGVTWWGDIFANISADGREMVVDFSPKGGPTDVVAQLTPSGHITWTGDNAWERISYENSFAGEYNSVFQGDTLPNFPDEFENVFISVSPSGTSDAAAANAIISAAAWGDATVSATIYFNQLIADFSSVGGSADVRANLTESGDMLWLDTENIWERSLCSGGAGASSSDSDSDGGDIAIDALYFALLISLTGVCSAAIGAVGMKWYDSRAGDREDSYSLLQEDSK